MNDTVYILPQNVIHIIYMYGYEIIIFAVHIKCTCTYMLSSQGVTQKHSTTYMNKEVALCHGLNFSHITPL